MKKAGWYLLLVSVLLSGSVLVCNRDIAGSATETGNVAGKVVSSATGGPVAGASISLFKKKLSVASPDETVVPEKELYSDKEGNFSLTLENGNYTIVASDGSEFAFVDDVIPATDESKNLTVLLETPGGIRGQIDNSLELRGTGSVIVHLIGTAIYSNVANDGTFLIEDIPPGTYTLASYSTYQEEFSPDYRQVTVYSDSMTDLGNYSLIYNGIPIPRNVVVVYDTVNEVVRISWDPIEPYDDFQEYAILRGIGGQAEHSLSQIAYTVDTFYIDSMADVLNETMDYEYGVRVNNKLGETGSFYGVYMVEVIPLENVFRIYAGDDRSVNPAAEVTLQGVVELSMCPVIRKEWKIGDAEWVTSDNGAVVFTTDSSYEPEIITCRFRVTDSAGNALVDTLAVEKKLQVKVHGLCPGAIATGSSMTYYNGKCWFVGMASSSRWAVWSSDDLTEWKLTAAFDFSDGGVLTATDDALCLVRMMFDSVNYTSGDGVEWKEVAVAGLEKEYFVWWHSEYYSFTYNAKINILLPYDLETNQAWSWDLLMSENCSTWQSLQVSGTSSLRALYFGLHNGKLIKIGREPTNEKKIYLSNEGDTWSRTGLWDDDYETFQDEIYFFKSSDSCAIALFQDVPGTGELYWAIFKNGSWTITPHQSISLPISEPSDRYWRETRWFQMFGNRLVYIGEDGFFRSITFR